MLLAIDVGNTMTHYGLFRGDKLIRHMQGATLHSNMQGATLHSKCLRDNVLQNWTSQITEAVVCSVVPKVKIDLGVPTMVVNERLDLGLRICARTVGADRLANAVAAKFIYGYPAFVVDFGTAITIDVIGKTGDYLGGVIMPGVDMIRHGLKEKTALLPLVTVSKPKKILGQNTKDAIKSGLYYGIRAMVEQLVQDLKKELRFPPKTVIINTGGYAGLWGGRIDKFLTLKGLRIIYERNKNHRLHR